MWMQNFEGVRVLQRQLLNRLDTDERPSDKPWLVERLVVGFLYLFGLAEAAYPVAVHFHWIQQPVKSLALSTLSAALALCCLFLFWAVALRPRRLPTWFISHLLWLLTTHAVLLLTVAGAFLAVILAVLFVAVVRTAALLVYAPFVIGGAVFLWFAYRNVRGAVAFVMSRPVGALRYAALLEEEPPR
jgi:uncharacterized membrane protein